MTSTSPVLASRLPYTLNELMVVAAAREIRDGEVVFVGMRLPLIAFVVAKKTHAPNTTGLFENGVIRSTPSPELIVQNAALLVISTADLTEQFCERTQLRLILRGNYGFTHEFSRIHRFVEHSLPRFG
jgi:acyl CoA:acetate/3-ketoacid CoA transferase beta subunit